MHFSPFHHNQDRIDLGNEAPIAAASDKKILHDRRSVSIRWLSGTILTGVTSIILMGGALMAALDGQYSVVAATNGKHEAPSPRTESKTSVSTSVKGDRIPIATAQYATKQILPINVVKKDGDRELITVKPFTFVSSSIATRKNQELSRAIPAFNPLNMFSGAQKESISSTLNPTFSNSIYGAKVEGEVSISLTAFPADSNLIDMEATLGEASVEHKIRQAAKFLSTSSINTAAQAIVDPARFDYNLARQPEFARLAVRITPENVSFVSRQKEEIRFIGMDEHIIPISEENDIYDVLRDNNIGAENAERIREAFVNIYGVSLLQKGHRLRIAYQYTPDEQKELRAERISLYSDTVHKATIARSDDGVYIASKEPATFLADAFAEADRISYGGQTPSLYNGLYQTGLEQDMDIDVIDEMIRIFSFDVDFNSHVQPGDALQILYADANKNENSPSEVLYAALVTRSGTRKFYRFHTPDDGLTDYYDDNGQSAKKFLMRKPVSSGIFRSGFGMRRHPIHRYVKMHTGVDWAASRGTPIMAAGNGTVIKAGWSSGYGQRVEIRHANGYKTTYSHLSGFAAAAKVGATVRQGQIIGYIGSTGLSTGPHLHYEVMVNDRYVDPMRIRLPRGRVLDGEMRAKFEAERQRIDGLLEKTHRSTRVASTVQ